MNDEQARLYNVSPWMYCSLDASPGLSQNFGALAGLDIGFIITIMSLMEVIVRCFDEDS